MPKSLPTNRSRRDTSGRTLFTQSAYASLGCQFGRLHPAIMSTCEGVRRVQLRQSMSSRRLAAITAGLLLSLAAAGPTLAVPPSTSGKSDQASSAPSATVPPASPGNAGNQAATDQAATPPATPAAVTSGAAATEPKVEGSVVETNAAPGENPTATVKPRKKKATGKAKQERIETKVILVRKKTHGTRDNSTGDLYEKVIVNAKTGEPIDGEQSVQGSLTQTAAAFASSGAAGGSATDAASATTSTGFGLFAGGSDDDFAGDLALGTPTLSPNNVGPMKAAIDRYTKIVEAGGWAPVPALQMEVGTKNDAVVLLRRRLEAEGDLEPGGFSFGGESYYDTSVAAAVQRFQRRNGLRPTGDLLDKDRTRNGTRTITALNVPASARLAQLKANLTRLQGYKHLAGKRYVMVNIPAQQIEAVNNDVVELRLNAVVGKPDRPSPTLSSAIYELNFNPTWTVPPTVLREDLIPKGRELQRKGQDVLAKFGIDAYDGSGRKVDSSKIDWNSAAVQGYRYTQQPSPDNPLGFVKINFNSPESVYMHDTPSKKLFDREYRAASSGCVRVEDAGKLATWLLRDTPGWSKAKVMSMKESGERVDARLKSGVPLQWVYITAWVSEDGIVNFRRDIYGKDQAHGVDKLASAY